MNENVLNKNLTFNQYLTKVFGLMGLGLGITTVVSYLFGTFMPQNLLTSSLMIVAIFAELVIALILGFRLEKMSVGGAWFGYILYSVCTGISISYIFMYYSLGSIALAFGTTCVMFICLAIIGHTTKMDLSKIGTILFAGLITIIIASIVNIFLRSSMFNWILTYASIVIFLGYTAYDTQKIRSLYEVNVVDSEMGEKYAIMGALQLYLDFVNLFLRILEIFGKGDSED